MTNCVGYDKLSDVRESIGRLCEAVKLVFRQMSELVSVCTVIALENVCLVMKGVCSRTVPTDGVSVLYFK
jgi:hypothetical protein